MLSCCFAITSTTSEDCPTSGYAMYTSQDNNTFNTVGTRTLVLRRMSVSCGSPIIEDIDHCNRVQHMIRYMSSNDSRANDSMEGFQGKTGDSVLGPDIYKDQSKITSFTHVPGLLNKEQYLLIKRCPLNLEQELVNRPVGIPILRTVQQTMSYFNAISVLKTSVPVLSSRTSFDMGSIRLCRRAHVCSHSM